MHISEIEKKRGHSISDLVQRKDASAHHIGLEDNREIGVFSDNRTNFELITNKVQKPVEKVSQLKNSKTPNWYQAYQKANEIHGQGIGNYIQHVEHGEVVDGSIQGLHSLPNGNPPNGVTLAAQSDVGRDSVGKVLWYFTNSPGAQGTEGDPIRVKGSTIFPTKLSIERNGITGVRALMKAAASNNNEVFKELIARSGLTQGVEHNSPTIYPKGSKLKSKDETFQGGNDVYYKVI